MPLKAPMCAALFTLSLGLGVAGDLAKCAWIPVHPLWIPLLTACHYIAILLAAVGFGLEIGLGAVVVVGIAHITASTTACGESIWQQGEVAAFIVVGLLAELLVKRKQATSGTVLTRQPANLPASGKVTGSPERAIPVGFIRAVRTPLSALESAGYMLEDLTLTDANHREVGAIILRECHRLDALIRSVEFGQRLPVYKEVDISAVLDEIVRRGAHLTETASITLRKEEGSGLRVVCDSEFLEQAVLNLLANALWFAKRGDEIMLSARADQSTATIEVSTQRIGILGRLGITMAALPESALHATSLAAEAPIAPEGGTQ